MHHRFKAARFHREVGVEHHHGGRIACPAHGGVDPAGIAQIAARTEGMDVGVAAAHQCQGAVAGGIVCDENTQGQVGCFHPQALQQRSHAPELL